MPGKRRAGIIQLKIDGVQYDAKGDFTYNLGYPKNEAIIGADKPHGYKSTAQVGYIEGKITDWGNLSVKDLVTMDGGTGTLQVGNGKLIVGKEMWYAGEGNVTTAEAEIDFRIESEEVLEEI